VQVLIVTVEDDLHALSVQAVLRNRGTECSILESDRLSGHESLSLLISPEGTASAKIQNSEGKTLSLSTIGVIWWRRPKALQQVDATSLSSAQLGLINNDCSSALVGLLEGCFQGKWISSPKATEFASNKLNQLLAVHKCDIRIPDTLITQDPAELAAFYKRHGGRIILKPVAGTPGPLLFTQFVRQEHLDSHDSIRSCPTMYQEFVPGTRHIRLNCFGTRSFAGLIETESLDWRPNLTVPVSKWPVPDSLHRKVRRALDLLGLEMGIVDLKEKPDGELVWLEVNPQGQFLFLEGLTCEPLREHFADFLGDELDSVSVSSTAGR
jgi:hypothetical protein